MRRWRKVAGTTFLLAALIILIAHQQHELPGGRQLNAILQDVKSDGSGAGSSEKALKASDDSSKPLPPVGGIEAHQHTEQESDTQPPPPPPVSPPEPHIPETAQIPLEGFAPLENAQKDAQLPPANAFPDSETALPPPPFQPEYLFQSDLPLDLPIEVLTRFSTHRPHNQPIDPSAPPQPIYATFMATRNPSLHDPYYLAIHSLLYRILWSPSSKTTRPYVFVVFVGEWVTTEQRALLAGAGALVRELPALAWDPPGEGIQARWRDLFAKLHLWNESSFSKILFLDADAFPVANIDGMFDLAPVQECRREKLALDDELPDGRDSPCEPYIFAGAPQSASSADINVGSMILSPSSSMHSRLLQNYLKFDRYDVRMAEQAFLNWQFSSEGAFPATVLGREWGAVFPREDEEGRLKVVHEKLWAAEEGGWLRRVWVEGWVEMTQFYMGAEFEKLRGMDGVA